VRSKIKSKRTMDHGASHVEAALLRVQTAAADHAASSAHPTASYDGSIIEVGPSASAAGASAQHPNLLRAGSGHSQSSSVVGKRKGDGGPDTGTESAMMAGASLMSSITPASRDARGGATLPSAGPSLVSLHSTGSASSAGASSTVPVDLNRPLALAAKMPAASSSSSTQQQLDARGHTTAHRQGAGTGSRVRADRPGPSSHSQTGGKHSHRVNVVPSSSSSNRAAETHSNSADRSRVHYRIAGALTIGCLCTHALLAMGYLSGC